MKLTSILAVAVIAFSSAASAGGAPIWTGVYLGAHAGGGFGKLGDSTTTFDTDGFVGGVHGGYNFTTSGVVFGVEGDFSWSNVEGSKSFDFGGVTAKATVGSDWLASIRGRVGVPVTPSLLLYGTAGVAWADVNGRVTVSTGDISSISSTQTGYVVGGGGELAFDRNWSGRVEALYYAFDDAKFSTAGATPFDASVTVVRAGLTYHLN